MSKKKISKFKSRRIQFVFLFFVSFGGYRILEKWFIPTTELEQSLLIVIQIMQLATALIALIGLGYNEVGTILSSNNENEK